MTPREFQLELFMRAVTAYAVKSGDNIAARQLAHDLSTESVKDCIRLGLFKQEDVQGYQPLPLQSMPQQQGQQQPIGTPMQTMGPPIGSPTQGQGAGLSGVHQVVQQQVPQPNPMTPYPQQQPTQPQPPPMYAPQQPTQFAPQQPPQAQVPGTQPHQQLAVAPVQAVGAPGYPPVAVPVAAPAVHIPVVGAPTPQAAIVGQVQPSVVATPTAHPAQAPQGYPPVVGQPTTTPQTQTQQPIAQPIATQQQAQVQQPTPPNPDPHPQAQPTPQPTGVGGAQTPIATGEGQVAQPAQPVDIAGTRFVPPAGQTFQPPTPIGSLNTVQQGPIPQGNSALGGPGIVSEPVQQVTTPQQVVAPGNQAVQGMIGAAPVFVKEQVVR